MNQAITEALRKLDTSNDNHWTADGLPRLDTVKMLAANPGLNREAVEAAAPGFTRTGANEYQWPEAAAADSAAQQPGETPAATPAAPNPDSPAAPEATPGSAAVTAQDPGTESGDTPFPAAEAPKQSEVAGSGSDPVSDEIATLEAEVAKAREAEAEIRDRLNQDQKALADCLAYMDARIAKLDKLKPKEPASVVIQDYLASQRRSLDERAARKQLIKDSGINLKELARDLKSPIDAAMARKNSRGTARPTGA